MWQEIIVYVIGICCIAYIGWKVYKRIKHPEQTGCSCSDCSSCSLGCSLKDSLKEASKKDKEKKEDD